MSELALLSKRLFDKDSLNVSNIKMFPGSSRDTTAEQFSTQINKVISQIEAGDFEIVDLDEGD
jgi:hypothetical protein